MMHMVYVSIDMAATGQKIDRLRKERNISVAQMVNGLGLTSPRVKLSNSLPRSFKTKLSVQVHLKHLDADSLI